MNAFRPVLSPLLWVLSATVALAADPGTIIKQKARDAANTPPPASAPGRAPTPSRPPPPGQPARVVVPIQQAKPRTDTARDQWVEQFLGDLNTIKAGAKATTAQRNQLMATLESAAQGGRKPSSDALSKLGNHLAAAWPNQKISAADLQHFARDVHTVLNSGTKSAQAQTSLNSAQLVLKYSGMSRGHAQRIGDELKSIAADLQK